MKRSMTKGLLILASVTLGLVLSLGGASAASKEAVSAKVKAEQKIPAGTKVDLNTATQADLEKLPGVGAATVKKIIAGRPYTTAADLAKAGVPAKTVEKLTPLVTVGAASAVMPKTALPKELANEKQKAKVKTETATKLPSGAKIDLNTAAQAELEKLPGVGPATAKKIIVGRPYASAADLAKAGLPAKTIEKLTPLVTIGAASAVMPKTVAPKSAATVAPATAKPVKALQPPPAGKNMVWVNPDSKIYHRQGSTWYGKTKQGSYMNETEAVKAGYRESKQGSQ